MSKAEIEAQIPSLRRYGRALTGNRATADDLVQDTLERALSRLALWRPGSSMRAWLFTIMRNLWINEVQRRASRPALHSLDDVAEPVQPPSQLDRLALRDLGAALAALPEDQREIVLLVGLEGMSYAEAAEVTGIPIGTVMSRLKRGRDRLASLLQGIEPSGPKLRRVK